MPERYDLIVIGGGPAGYVGAIRAAQLGKKVACIERERVGGTCLNWGCIPSKSLLRNAELYQFMKNRSKDFGFKFEQLDFDWLTIIKRSRRVTDQLAGGIEFLFKKNKVQYLKGEAELADLHLVKVKQTNSETQLLESSHILVCSGVQPRPLPGLDFNGTTIISSKEAMVLPKRPNSIVIVGAGAIGVEFAYFFNAFGTDVTLVEMKSEVLPVEDSEISQALEKSFKRQGIQILTETKVERAQVNEKEIQVALVGKNNETINAEIVLVASGVEAVYPIGLTLDHDTGFIKVDECYQTEISGVYAAGDIIGPPWLAHVATYEAIQAVNGMFTDSQPKRVQNFPNCTYCQPQVASIGLTERAIKESGAKYRIGRFPFKGSGKALAVGESEGFVKIIFSENDRAVLGAHMIGSDVTELIAELGLAMTLEATFEEIDETIHAHPTLGEAIHEASLAAFQQAIHI